MLTGAIRVPDAVGAITITVDVRAGRATCHTDIDAPRQGRPQTRVNWLVRQLKNAPDGVRVEAFMANARGAGTTDLLGGVRENPALLVADPKRDIKSFRVALSAPLGTKRARGRGGFIHSVLDLTDTFYADVLQNLKAWSATPQTQGRRPRNPTTRGTGIRRALFTGRTGRNDARRLAR